MGLHLYEGGLTAVPPSRGAFGFAWYGARGTFGVCGGRHRFSCTMPRELPPDAAAAASAPPGLDATPGVRIGVSTVSAGTVLQ